MASGSLLVVDDEESVAVTMGAILEMDGYDGGDLDLAAPTRCASCTRPRSTWC